MSSLIQDPNAPLVREPYDQFWDGPPKRREMQAAFIKLGRNDADLMLMVDNLNLVVNYLCEKQGVTKEDLDKYVEEKKAQMEALRAAAVAQVESIPEAAHEQSTS